MSNSDSKTKRFRLTVPAIALIVAVAVGGGALTAHFVFADSAQDPAALASPPPPPDVATPEPTFFGDPDNSPSQISPEPDDPTTPITPTDPTPTNPPAIEIPKTGPGTFTIATGAMAASGPKPLRYRVEIEDGLPFDADETAAFIDETLTHPLGWGATGKHAFERVSDESFNIRILIATPDTVDKLCAPLRTNGKYSCGRESRATINATRWAEGADAYGDDLTSYRRYVIAHEVGHLLSYQHTKCPGAGELAPIMVQQTITVEDCLPNPWPHPEAGQP